MDRRDALKLMGFSLAAIAMAGIAPKTHACPQKALTLKSNWPGAPGERNPKARYRNPNVSLMDIIKSNRQ